jgi:hypothetical protein
MVSGPGPGGGVIYQQYTTSQIVHLKFVGFLLKSPATIVRIKITIFFQNNILDPNIERRL